MPPYQHLEELTGEQWTGVSFHSQRVRELVFGMPCRLAARLC